MVKLVDTRDLKSLGYCIRVGSSPTSPTMKNTISSPHFYRDCRYDGTFEDLMDQAVGGISKYKYPPRMHLWLPSSATQTQIDLVKKMIGDDTGRNHTNTW